jgi:hypothetical protein
MIRYPKNHTMGTAITLSLRARRSPKNHETATLNWGRVCEYCFFPVTKFRDKASTLEYNWSGYCQLCQDDDRAEKVSKGIKIDPKRTIKKGLTRIGTAKI